MLQLKAFSLALFGQSSPLHKNASLGRKGPGTALGPGTRPLQRRLRSSAAPAEPRAGSRPPPGARSLRGAEGEGAAAAARAGEI